MALPWGAYDMGYGGSADPAVDYSFDPQNFYDPSANERVKLGGNQLDMNLASYAAPVVGGIAGIVDAFVGAKRRKEKYQQFERKAQEILSRKIDYEIPKESLEMLALTKEGAGKVREYSQEALDLAKEQTGKEKMPGYDIIREGIQSGQAQATQDVVSLGGIESLGKISDIYQRSQDSLKNLALQNLKYRSSANREYRNALKQRANAELSAVGLETVGLGEMNRQREQEYQIEVLDPHYNKMQFEISQIGNKMAAMDTSINWGQALGGLVQVGTQAAIMAATGGAGGAAGLGAGII